MYALHYAPDNASLIIRIALQELGLPFQAVLVDRAVRAQDSAAYRAINPTGLIPALETPAGVLFETAAMLLWLNDRHGQLGQAPDAPGRGDFLKWLFFLSNTAHADLRQLFYPTQYVPESAVEAHHALMTARLQRHFSLLDAAAAQQPALFALPSALAIYVCVLMRWSVLYPKDQRQWFQIADYPALHAIARQMDIRPATLTAAQAEGLGATPFTAPTYATPAEGCAL